MRTALALLVAASLAGCTVDGDPDVPVDAGRDAPRSDTPLLDVGHDAGATDAPLLDAPALDDTGMDAALDDAGTDGGLEDAGIDDAGLDGPEPVDAPSDVPPGSDAGPPAPTVDGVLAAGEWAASVVATDLTVTAWAGNELRGLRALIHDGSLYIALEGRIEGGNAMAVYIDRDLDEAVGVADLSTLTDADGALDNAITGGLVTPSGFRTDAIFGTLDLSRSATGFDARMGFRDLVRATGPSDLYWISADVAPIVCAAATCEARLPLSELGGTAPRRLGLFARILNNDGSMSPNQTLPSDDPALPRTVSAVLELPE